MSVLLPEGFAALEPYVGRWSVTGSAARAARRGACSQEEQRAFYDAAQDMLVPALAYLDGKKLDAFDAADTRLMDMMLSLAHVALAVEGLGDDEPRHAEMRKHMHITRSPAGA